MDALFNLLDAFLDEDAKERKDLKDKVLVYNLLSFKSFYKIDDFLLILKLIFNKCFQF